MPPASAHQCLINATYQCLPVHIHATCQCPSELPFSASQGHLSMPVSATHQCCQSVPPISAMPISATYKCPSVKPISAHHCSLISTHQ
ncbi:unnamed protein product [Staurois parvus]|uniref:Uncharacterized protein n=1 Tax=Staurois parvus TaxID=386267 RepID=A0ABN9FYZ9_9NEOB|nr:unnamed protein product [Staurois parvus]